MLHSDQASILFGAEAQRLDRLGAIAEREHLLPRKRDPNRALEANGREGGHEQLIIRPEPRTEGAPDIGRQDPHLVLGKPKHVAEVIVTVRSTLRFVVYGQASVALPHRRAPEALHGIVVLDRGAIFVPHPDGRARQGLLDIAAAGNLP
jgi:hypothetical protein